MQEIFWLKLDKFKYYEFFSNLVKLENQKIIFTPNPEILLKVRDDTEFKNMLEKADFLLPDGIGLFIAFQILEENNRFFRLLKIPYYFFNLFFRRNTLYERYWDRICWSDLTKDLLNYAEKNAIKITIIDLYNPSDIKKVESQSIFSGKLKEKFNNLNFDYFIYNPEKKLEIIDQIKNSSSKIVFSTLWMKKQEQSVIEIMENCSNIKLWLWVWSSFDYYIWFQKRAPYIFRTLWLEWFYRLLTWPKKIDRLNRLYNAIIVFLWEVVKYQKKK